MRVDRGAQRRPRAGAAHGVGRDRRHPRSLLPWVTTGSRRRHSYDVFVLVERLGFSSGGIEAAALRWWPLMPLQVIAAVVIAWWGGWPAVGTLGVIGGAYAAAVGITVATASPGGGIEIDQGPVVTAVGGALLVVGSVAELLAARRAR